MTRLRFGYIPLTFFLAIVPIKTFAAGFLGPIVPAACKCANQTIVGGSGTVSSAPDFGCIFQVLQNLIKVAVSLGVIFMVFWIAYAGFSLMVSGGSAQARSQGKTRVTNAVVGIFVILCAWLIVDFVMKAIYEPNAVFSGQKIGPWNAILAGTGSDLCIVPKQPTAISVGTVLTSILPGPTVGPGGVTQPGGVGVVKGLCSDSNTSCSVSVLEKEGLNQAQASAMSCIAVTESAGGAKKGNSGTGALGLFQITGTNWNNPAYHQPPCSSSTSRLDDTCNRQAAVLMFKSQGYQPWTGKCNVQSGCGYVSYGQYWNPDAVACVNKYDP